MISYRGKETRVVTQKNCVVKLTIFMTDFNRTIELPAEVDPNKVNASYKKGILKIKLKKTKSSETKRIKVTSG